MMYHIFKPITAMKRLLKYIQNHIRIAYSFGNYIAE